MSSRNRIVGENQAQRAERRLRRDARDDENIGQVGYMTEGGTVTAWTGDEEAPYVKLLGSLIGLGPAEFTWLDTNGLLNFQVVKATAGKLYQHHLMNVSASNFFWQLFNTNVQPAPGAIPKMALPFFGGGTIAVTFSEWRPRDDFSVGITWTISSTPDTYTPIIPTVAIGTTGFI